MRFTAVCEEGIDTNTFVKLFVLRSSWPEAAADRMVAATPDCSVTAPDTKLKLSMVHASAAA